MRQTQDIQFAIAGQVLVFDAPEGRPASVTSVKVFPWDVGDDAVAEDALDAPAIESAPNTTIDAQTGGPIVTNQRQVNVAATTGAAVDRRYLITAARGHREWIEVASIKSADWMLAKAVLCNEYASGDTVQSTRITVALKTAWVSDEANLDVRTGIAGYRVRWVYVVGGITYVHDSYMALVRYPGQHAITAADMDAAYPQWSDKLPTDHRADQGRRLIAEAYQDVRDDLAALGTSADAFANAETFDGLVKRKTIHRTEWCRYLAAGQTADSTRVEMAAKDYEKRLQDAVSISARAQQRDSTGAARDVAAVPITRR